MTVPCLGERLEHAFLGNGDRHLDDLLQQSGEQAKFGLHASNAPYPINPVLVEHEMEDHRRRPLSSSSSIGALFCDATRARALVQSKTMKFQEPLASRNHLPHHFAKELCLRKHRPILLLQRLGLLYDDACFTLPPSSLQFG